MDRVVTTPKAPASTVNAELGGAIPVAPDLEHPVLLRRRGPVRFCDHGGAPLACQPYLLVVDGKGTTGVTDPAGWMGPVDPSASSADVYLGAAAFHLVFASPSGDVAKAQSALNALGFSAGPADGDLGLRTRVALASYQTMRGLARTGNADSTTILALTADHVVNGPGGSGA
jgi:hypothetical protein